MADSPTTRTLKYLRGEGYLTAVVEKWNHHARIRQDLFGIVDVLGIKAGQTIAVQCTSYGGLSDRKKKIRESDNARKILDAGWLFMMHGWHKKGRFWVVKEINVEEMLK